MQNNSDSEDKERLKGNLKAAQGGRTPKEMAEALGFRVQTYYSRLENPETLKYSEIKTICNYCNVDITQFVAGRVSMW